MSASEEDTYSTIFGSLKHPIRRKILRILSLQSASFSDLQKQVNIESPLLTYHLEGLGSLLVKTDEGKYMLSLLGEAAVSTMKNVEEPPIPLHLRPSTKTKVAPQEQAAKPWLVGLIALATIYITIVISVAVLKIWTDPSVWPSAIVLLSFLFVGYSVYVAYSKKRIIDLTIGLCIVGLLFIVIGSMVLVPYATSETFRTETSQDITHEIISTTIQPMYRNGSLAQISLPSNTSQTFICESEAFNARNESIFQIEVSGSNLMNFVMKPLRPDTSEIFLNETFNTAVGGPVGEHWLKFFWTPPGTSSYMDLGFIFTNPNSQDAIFYFRVTSYYLKATGELAVTNYRPFGDPNLPYIGLLMIGVAVAFNIYSLKDEKSEQRGMTRRHDR